MPSNHGILPLEDERRRAISRVDDSGTDRLNYYYTSMVIFMCAFTITAYQYVGNPLQCWVPRQFEDAWEQYAERWARIPGILGLL